MASITANDGTSASASLETTDLERGDWSANGCGKKIWGSTAPKRVSRHCLPGEEGKGWEAWAEYLADRKRLADLRKLFSSKDTPLLWCASETIVSAGDRQQMAALASGGKRPAKTAEAIEDWLACEPDRDRSPSAAILSLSVAHALPQAAQFVLPDTWWKTLLRLRRIVDDAATMTIDRHHAADIVLSAQLLAGELPWTLAYLFPEIRPCGELGEAAQAAVSSGIEALCDGEGVLPFQLVDIHRPLAASWTRCQMMASAAQGLRLTGDASVQMEWHVRQWLRTARSDGGPLLGAPRDSTASHSTGMLSTLLRLAGDASDIAAAMKSLPGKWGTPCADAKRAGLPDPSVHSEWAGLTVLRTDWRRRAPRIAIGYEGPRMQVELETGRETVFEGDWEVDIEIGGKRIALANDWDEVCWYSDDEVDYVEFSTDLKGGGQIERQIILAREDQFLLLVDNVLPKRGTGIRYTSRLPIAADAEWLPREETVDGLLIGKQPLSAVLPLALCEWRCDDRVGSLDETDGAIVLKQRTDGGNMCCPLFFDFKPSRLARERTWRQLTVAEMLEIQPPDVATGFRIQCGKQQWLAYRSLDRCGNRTLLGQNFSSEFFLGRFLRDGSAEELVEIEAGEE